MITDNKKINNKNDKKTNEGLKISDLIEKEEEINSSADNDTENNNSSSVNDDNIISTSTKKKKKKIIEKKNNDNKEKKYKVTNLYEKIIHKGENFNYDGGVDKNNKRLLIYNSKLKRENTIQIDTTNNFQQIPEDLKFNFNLLKKEFIPSEDTNFKRQFINGLTKRKLITFCFLIIITIIIAFRFLILFYYKSELEIMKNQIDCETKFFLSKEIEKDPFFKINKKKVFFAGAVSFLMTAIILYLTVKKPKLSFNFF